MEKPFLKRKKDREATSEALMQMDKADLVAKIIQLEAHNKQLRNIISKQGPGNSVSTKVGQKSFDFAKCSTRRVLLRFLYFGWDYQGLAVQEDSAQTIEHHLFRALTRSCLIQSREEANYHRCGRTDKGVSSAGQVISISLRSKLPASEHSTVSPESVGRELPYCKMLNRLLPKEIRAVAWMPVPGDRPEYSARFSCVGRVYRYYFPRGGLHLPAMREAAAHLVGSHDFRNLCKMDVGNGVVEFVRNIRRVVILPVDPTDTDKPTSMFYLEIEGNAFLWHQIRCTFAVLLLCGRGDERSDVTARLLDVAAHERKPQYSMASHLPLNLYRCSYELERDSEWVCDREELRCVIAQLKAFWTEHSVKATMIKDCLRSLEQDYTKSETNISRESETTISTQKETTIPGESETTILGEKETTVIGQKETPLSGQEETSVLREKETCYTDCLLEGVKPRIYKPLFERDTCASLEEKIEYYSKKRKRAKSSE